MDKKTTAAFLKNSYKPDKKQAAAIAGYLRDDSLSGNRSQVYYNPNTNDNIVVHTGSKSATDWLISDVALGFGQIGATKRGKHAKQVVKDTVKKYGADSHTTVLGHSLGGGLAVFTGQQKGVDSVITVNKGDSMLKNTKQKLPGVEQVHYRHVADPISLISGGLLEQNTMVNTSRTANPHSIEAGLGI